MARRPAGLLVEEWAETAGTKETPESQGLVRTEGWPDPYSVDQFPQLGVFNQMWREFSAALVDIAERGILEWDVAQEFAHPSHCVGSDGRTYQSVQSSTGEDPVTDAATVYWRPLIATPGGNMAAATAAQVEAGASTSLFLAPARFLAGLFKAAPNARWRAAAARYGLVRLGTQAEIDGGSADRIPTGATLQAAIPTGTVVVNSSTSQRGIIRTATAAEGDGGVASSPAMTPALVQRKLDALIDSAPGTLNTLDELAEALGDDPNLAATLTGLINAIAGRVTTLEGGVNVIESIQRGYAYLEFNGNDPAGTTLEIILSQAVDVAKSMLVYGDAHRPSGSAGILVPTAEITGPSTITVTKRQGNTGSGVFTSAWQVVEFK